MHEAVALSPQQTDLSVNRLSYYTGTPASAFQRYVLLTNYGWHARAFRARFPDAVGPDRDSRQMPAWHHVLADRSVITLINIGFGPSNAKTLTGPSGGRPLRRLAPTSGDR
jgi:AMP nucleosidase